MATTDRYLVWHDRVAGAWMIVDSSITFDLGDGVPVSLCIDGFPDHDPTSHKAAIRYANRLQREHEREQNHEQRTSDDEHRAGNS